MAANGTGPTSNMNDQLDPKWYFGRLSRHEADSYLQNAPPGTYLVRDSSTSIGDYVLCVSENSRVSHYIIQSPMHTDLNKYVIGDQSFNTLPQVLDFYKVHILDTTFLREPFSWSRSTQEDSMSTPIAPNAMGQNSQVPPLPPPNAKPSELGLVCRALFNFTKTDDEDLSFTRDEILTIIRKDEEQWWLARNSAGQEGLVPANYIRAISDPHEAKGAGDNKTTTNNDQYRVLNQLNPDIVQYAIVKQGRIPSAYDPSQLKLEVNDIIKVLEKNVSGNWKGEINGKQGFFPFTRVELLDQQSYDELMEERRKAGSAKT